MNNSSTADFFDTSETTILKQKLKSKAEALYILSKELENIKKESGEYKELIHKLQSQYSEIKINETLYPGGFNSRTFRDHAVGHHFNKLRDENKRLLAERESCRILLREKEEEVQLIRQQRLKDKKDAEERAQQKNFLSKSDTDEIHQVQLLNDLETLQVKYSALKHDLQSIFDEKEDLVNERDAYKGKVHRLNHALNALLKSDGYKTMDLDCLISENRYLQQRLEQIQEEKELANEMGRRYKSALDKNKNRISRTHLDPERDKELKRLIDQTSFPCPKNLDFNDSKSMYELCHSLLETLNDRMTQLKHQRKANKYLLERLSQLEEKIYSKENGELILWPSHYLMKGYNPSDKNIDIIIDSGGEGDYSPELDELFEKFQEISALTSSDTEISEVKRPSAPIPILHCDIHGDEENDNLPAHLKLLVEQAMNNLDDNDAQD
ncbi:unnamed protein product [Lepeophtheirus salmonis]|uniref:(salmon louse) hypothetical protein n=1 Tax=Lepeophtheirus salmonis TaxID=72036 RepID=A0A0K2V912_LEPSM|nr:coiled-coil domain-containing protein 149-like [Lepeophtheirus salmonis]CAB4061640.1 unnamed protein product [Lepeophtheirus salmonis]CAF2888239.1 unnamed protein product [Lepeophtheirus salmonis]